MSPVLEKFQVGPVLRDSGEGRDIASAILSTNDEASMIDRGGYLRIVAPSRCVLKAETVEALTGRAFSFPSDLEKAMVSFKGKLRILENEAIWEALE